MGDRRAFGDFEAELAARQLQQADVAQQLLHEVSILDRLRGKVDRDAVEPLQRIRMLLDPVQRSLRGEGVEFGGEAEVFEAVDGPHRQRQDAAALFAADQELRLAQPRSRAADVHDRLRMQAQPMAGEHLAELGDVQRIDAVGGHRGRRRAVNDLVEAAVLGGLAGLGGLAERALPLRARPGQREADGDRDGTVAEQRGIVQRGQRLAQPRGLVDRSLGMVDGLHRDELVAPQPLGNAMGTRPIAQRLQHAGQQCVADGTVGQPVDAAHVAYVDVQQHRAREAFPSAQLLQQLGVVGNHQGRAGRVFIRPVIGRAPGVFSPRPGLL